MKLKLDPTRKLVLALSALVLGATIYNFSGAVLLHLTATIGFALALYWFYTKFSSKRKNIWNTLITAEIIFLVLHYGTSGLDLIYPLIATFIAITWKFFVEYRGSTVVNPAAGSILLMAAIVALIPGLDKAFVSWWGASFMGYFSLVIVALWMIFGVDKWKKWPAVISFLIAHAAVLIFRGQSFDFISYVFTDSTIFFFATIMLVDPMTSPSKKRDQIYFGLVAALFYNVFTQYGIPYYGLFAIVAANLANILLKPKLKKKKN